MKRFIWLPCNTLSKRINKDIKDTFYKNDNFLRNRWGGLEWNIVRWSTEYLKYSFITLIAFSLFGILISLSIPLMILVTPLDSINWEDYTEWQTTFLSGQLTVLAVVYPLVVGLVSVLFQNKADKNAILPVYQIYSGFMFAGLSGLFLSAYLVIGYLIAPHISTISYAAFSISSAMWVLLNISLTAWFFVQTFKILDDSSREKIMLRYTIQESCIHDVKGRLSSFLLEQPSTLGVIKEKYGYIKIKSSISFYSNKGCKEIVRGNLEGKYIVDVNYTLINLALHIQSLLLKNNKDKSELSLNLSPVKINGGFRLARYQGFEINPFVRFVLKHSFMFSNRRTNKNLKLSTIVDTFVGAAHDSIKSENSKEFSENLDVLANAHSEIASVLSFTNDNNELDNWMVLPSNSFLGRNYLDEFSSEYYQLARLAVEKLNNSSSFFHDMLYLYKKIYVRRDSLVRQEINSLLQGAGFCWFLLIDWRKHNRQIDNMRAEATYNRMLLDFVGYWEGWQHQIHPSKVVISDYDENLFASSCHLKETINMISVSLSAGNIEELEWSVDILCRWRQSFDIDDFSYRSQSWHSSALNHYYLKKPLDSPQWHIALNGSEFNQSDANIVCFSNLNKDLRLIAICELIRASNEENSSKIKKLVNSLMKGRGVKSQEPSNVPEPIGNASDIIGAYIRQLDWGKYSDNAYGNWLGECRRLFNDSDDEKRVSGRVYTSRGRSNAQSQSEFFVQIAIYISRKEWTLTPELRSTIFSELFSYTNRESILYELNSWISIAENYANTLNAEEDSKVIPHMSILDSSEDTKNLIETFIRSMNQAISEIKEFQKESLRHSKIDLAVVEEFAQEASRYFLDKDKKDFYPLSLFKIELCDYLESDFQRNYTFKSVDKYNFTTEIRSSNEKSNKEYYARFLPDRIKLDIFRSIFDFNYLYHLQCYSDMKAIELIVEYIPSIENPILFVSSSSVLNLLNRAKYQKELLMDFDISYRSEKERNYICTLEGCDIYRAHYTDVKDCFLLSRGVLDTIAVQKTNENGVVGVEYNLENKDHLLGSIKYTYSMDVRLSAEPKLSRSMRFTVHDNLRAT
ncbi:hypothetical protein C1N32_19930 [Vibrio diazotrophicus]|uniref:Uncharacterized protein n=1 Tax=Vibrio diazotrophicus TaxID=685 RepID=A0A2J8HU47_VIBDI|nr:hypothetical protein [Vibrio diazotrophicus]PNI01789.1 hypothetical protein C1N32_19930 [Vibrio diazotrophicus]RAS57201.1 hypothetical protein DET48_13638 [Vibrio diazotrophicus]